MKLSHLTLGNILKEKQMPLLPQIRAFTDLLVSQVGMTIRSALNMLPPLGHPIPQQLYYRRLILLTARNMLFED